MHERRGTGRARLLQGVDVSIRDDGDAAEASHAELTACVATMSGYACSLATTRMIALGAHLLAHRIRRQWQVTRLERMLNWPELP